ncbi:MAG: hypothetical protein ACR2MB_08465 [Acidimicrobiales bacterium]
MWVTRIVGSSGRMATVKELLADAFIVAVVMKGHDVGWMLVTGRGRRLFVPPRPPRSAVRLP